MANGRCSGSSSSSSSRRRRRRRRGGRWNGTISTYSFSFYSMFIDFPKWQMVGFISFLMGLINDE